jgi:hypothetical protein
MSKACEAWGRASTLCLRVRSVGAHHTRRQRKVRVVGTLRQRAGGLGKGVAGDEGAGREASSLGVGQREQHGEVGAQQRGLHTATHATRHQAPVPVKCAHAPARRCRARG